MSKYFKGYAGNNRPHKPVSRGVFKNLQHFDKLKMEWVNQWDTRTWISLRKVSSFPFPTMTSFYRFQQTFQFYFTYFARHRLFLKFSFEILQGKLARPAWIDPLAHARRLTALLSLTGGTLQWLTDLHKLRVITDSKFHHRHIDCLQHLLDRRGIFSFFS